MSDDVTPIRQQYLEIKRQYPDAILFFRLGDFYETFDEDAEITSRELDIVLTSRPVARGVRIPLAGIPYHAVENYLARLIEKGYHVAICEQVGDQPLKGIFPREVVRVVTPGTVIEPGLLKGDRNNYLAGVVFQDRPRRDRLRGHHHRRVRRHRTRRGRRAVGPARRVDPPEPGRDPRPRQRSTCPTACPGTSRRWPAWRFEPARCQEALTSHFQVAALDGFGLRGLSLAVRAAGAILQYLQETQPAALKLLGAHPHLQPERVHGPGCRHPPQPGADRDHARCAGGRLPARRAGLHRHRRWANA